MNIEGQEAWEQGAGKAGRLGLDSGTAHTDFYAGSAKMMWLDPGESGGLVEAGRVQR